MTGLPLRLIEDAIRNANPQKRHQALRAVADLFLTNAPLFDEEKVALFDNVFDSLVDDSSRSEMVDISRRMAPVENAPRRLIRKLAGNSDISVAGPVLSQSPRLSTVDLCELAISNSNLHLLAISRRTEIGEPLTDILLSRGDQFVAASVVTNLGAKLSPLGIGQILDRARIDNALAVTLRSRTDITEKALREAESGSCARAKDSGEAVARAKNRAVSVHNVGDLNELHVKSLALKHDYEGVIASLAILSRLDYETVENLMLPNRVTGVILICKAASFGLEVVDAVLDLAKLRNHLSPEEMQRAHREFITVARATAERIVRFWQVRHSVALHDKGPL